VSLPFSAIGHSTAGRLDDIRFLPLAQTHATSSRREAIPRRRFHPGSERGPLLMQFAAALTVALADREPLAYSMAWRPLDHHPRNAAFRFH
jgi:hypothetical protein